jgi:hypothetical protein
MKSVHGQLLARGDARGPVCIDCHSAHEIVNPTGNNFKAISDERCGKCHADRLGTLQRNLPRQGHGARQTQFRAGSRRVLRLPRLPRHFAAVRSAIAPLHENILVTCQKCHPGATQKFTQYQPHANPLDAKNYPLLHMVFLAMTGLLIGTFSFFGAHTLGWLVRAVLSYISPTPKNSARQNSPRRPATNGSRASCRSNASCISSW